MPLQIKHRRIDESVAMLAENYVSVGRGLSVYLPHANLPNRTCAN